MNINFEYYKVFYYIGKTGGITAAAEALSLSQPAVSQSLRQLEQALGITLFVRTAKGVRFTAEGELLFRYVKRGYEMIQNGEEKLRQMLDLERGEIRIGASDMTLQFFLLPFLERFHEQYPKIKVRVTNGPTPETLRYMQEGKIDFGVVSGPLPTKNDFHLTPVKEIQDVLVAGAKFEHLRDRELSFQELMSLPIICLEKNTSTRRYIDSFLADRKVFLEPEFELATSDMIVHFARKNLGIGCVVEGFAKESLKKGELFTLKFREQIPPRWFYAVSDDRYPLSGAAGKLFEMITT